MFGGKLDVSSNVCVAALISVAVVVMSDVVDESNDVPEMSVIGIFVDDPAFVDCAALPLLLATRMVPEQINDC